MSIDTTAPTETDELEDRVFTVSPGALEKVLEVRAGEDDPTALGLRIAVTGVNGVDYTYDLSFEELANNAADDHVEQIGDLSVVIPADSVEALRGAVLDLPSNPGQGGLVIRNPNRPDPLAGRALELTGDIADKIQTLLAEAINPGLAAHGGFASLVGVEDSTVFLSMGGGCQGCSLSQATMVQGIAATIREHIPEVTDVVDVTDHAAGENPFYD